MDNAEKAKQNASLITHTKKMTHLSSLSEDDFRDRVVRPVFFKKGLRDGRELCGPDEEGKDCLFVEEGRVKRILYAVQTKRGTLNMTREPKQNVAEAIAQLRTALTVRYPMLGEHNRVRPDYVILCASGKANTAARKYIVDEINDDRILIQDVNDLIPQIDEFYPEYWYGIDANKFPYYRNFKQELTQLSDVVLFDNHGAVASAVAERYVPMHIFRYTREIRRSHRKTESRPKLDRIPVAGVLKLRRQMLIAILGDAGAGKSTALKRLALQAVEEALGADTQSHIPILLRAKDLAADNARLLDVAGEQSKRIAGSENPCFSTDDLHAGRVILLIDALDEVTSEADKRTVAEKILALHAEYPQCRVVLTSRHDAFTQTSGLHAKFVTYELTPMSIEQVQQLVTKLVHVRSLQADTAQETLRKLNDVHGVKLNPLLVTIFVASSEYDRQDVPANITEVFKKYTEMMLGRWDQTKGFTQQYKYKIKDHLLQKLALEMHRRKFTSYTLMDAKRLIEDELNSLGQGKDVDEVFVEITDRSGLLRIIGEAVEFRHLLFQEFFAGRGIQNIDELRSVIHDPWWSKPALFFCGENPAHQNLLSELIATLDLVVPSQRYTAAVAIGSATQACYLSKVDDRIKSLTWVVRTVSEVMDQVIEENIKMLNGNRLIGFLMYYLSAKDSIASTLTGAISPRVLNSETEQFWRLAGMLEAGQIEIAETPISDFRTVDERLYLALYLACTAINGLRLTNERKKTVARRIVDKLSPKVRGATANLLKEFETLILEVQEGKLKALPSK